MNHVVFDVLGALAAVGVTGFVYRWRPQDAFHAPERAGRGYAASLILGAAVGGFALGTLNLHLSGRPGVGRSVLGALLGAIAAVEAYKLVAGIRGSTGLVFVPALCTGLIVGRVGCLLSGLGDFTFGTPTDAPWAWDFGDGVARHPVQLYEAGAMVAFLLAALVALGRRDAFFARNGFYLFAAWYGVQRYVWEFWKPYAPIVGRHNVFHIAALVLILYSFLMMAKVEHARTSRPT